MSKQLSICLVLVVAVARDILRREHSRKGRQTMNQQTYTASDTAWAVVCIAGQCAAIALGVAWGLCDAICRRWR